MVSHRCQLLVVATGMVPRPMSGIPINWRWWIPINWRWWTLHVLCTSAKAKVIDRVHRIKAPMVLLLSVEYAPNLVRSSGRADGPPVWYGVYCSIVFTEGV